MVSNIAVLRRYDEDEGRTIGRDTVEFLSLIETNDFEVGVRIVLMSAMIDDVSIVSAVRIPK